MRPSDDEKLNLRRLANNYIEASNEHKGHILDAARNARKATKLETESRRGTRTFDTRHVGFAGLVQDFEGY